MREVLGNSLISFAELATVINEIECILNSRPLSYMYDELGGGVLTLSYLFVGRRLLSLPSGNDTHLKPLEHDSEYTLDRRFLHLTRILSHFGTGRGQNISWISEKLTNLKTKSQLK